MALTTIAMASPTGLFAAHDTGAPAGSADYTTVVLVHGYGWHSEIFTRVLPHAHAQNARVITVNRRDYPGTTPYPPAERALLPPLPAGAAAPSLADERASMHAFMRLRGRELLAFLAELVRERGLPPARAAENKGGIVVGGWSLGIVWMNALLGELDGFVDDVGGVDLGAYLRRVVLYDGPSFEFGFPRPPDAYDPFITPGEFEGNERALGDWVSGYFTHGRTVRTLARRAHDAAPPPTLRTFAPEEMERTVERAPGVVGGSDQVVVVQGHRVGLFGALWEGAIALPDEDDEEGGEGGEGADEEKTHGCARDVEVRVLWCDRSTWETTHAAWSVRAEVAAARAAGRRIRDVRTLRLRGANHFAHWDFPAQTLHAFLVAVDEREPEVRVAAWRAPGEGRVL